MPDPKFAAQTHGPRRRGLWLAIAVVVALLLRLFRIDQPSLWIDEILTWHTALPGDALTLERILYNTHGPLVSVMLHGWIAVFGDSELALRLPFALASAALVPVLAAVAGRAAGERSILPAAWLAATSPFLVWYGQEVRNYSFAMLFAALQILFVLRYRRSGALRDLAGLALVAWLGALSNLNNLLLFPALLVALVLSPPPRRGRWLPPILTGGAVLLLWSPWLLTHFGVLELHRLVPGREALPGEEPLRGPSTFHPAAIPFTFFVFSVGFTLGPPLRELHADMTWRTLLPHAAAIGATAIAFGVLLLSGVLALRPRPFARGVVLASILVPLAWVTYFAVMNFKVFNPRYVSVALPAYLVLLAAGWAALFRPARILGALAVGTLFVASLVNLYWNVDYAKEDFRAVTRDLRELVAPQDVLLATGNWSPLEYYWRNDEPQPVIYWLGYARDDRMGPKFAELRNRTGPTWVVVSRPKDLDPESRFERWIIRTFKPEMRAYPGVRVYRVPAPDL